MDSNEDKHLDVCHSIEVGLKREYELQPELTDTLCVFALDAAKTSIKQRSGYAKNEKVDLNLPELNDLRKIVEEWLRK